MKTIHPSPDVRERTRTFRDLEEFPEVRQPVSGRLYPSFSLHVDLLGFHFCFK